MYISMNWIGDFVDLSGLDKEALIRRFTLSTAEVEDIIHKGKDTNGVVLAQIVSVTDHPKSQKLHLLKVNAGGEDIDVVCGAKNVREGMKVALATCGGMVSGQAINEAVVGGYTSFGMCCSEAELGLSADNSGIMDLSAETAPLGTDIKALFPIDDVVFEVDNKSLTNRPDLWGHYGIAREFATIAERPLLPVAKKNTSVYASRFDESRVVVHDIEHTFRYTAIEVENITVKQSPMAMRIRLFYCGSRSINFLADLTNYVMMELGQPMHAFDRRFVNAVEVQRFSSPFVFQTLDGVERQIDEDMLMICSGGKPVAIAGVMGGQTSGISDDTDALFLESATFDGVSVRKTSTKLALRTDASMRYEKTLDPELCVLATERFLYLLTDIDVGAKVCSALADKYVYQYETVTLSMDKAFVDRYTGIDIPLEKIESTLVALGFGVELDGETFTVTVPSWRVTKDVTLKADLIEEITRIYGYDNFAITTSKSPLLPVREQQGKRDDDDVKDFLVNRYSLNEVHSYIWSDVAKYRDIGIEVEDNVKLVHPQTPDHATLRRSMVPTLLSFVHENRGFADTFGIFEIGRVVNGLDEQGLACEEKQLGIVLYDRKANEETTFLALRDKIVDIFRYQKHVVPAFVPMQVIHAWEHPANTYAIMLDGVAFGTLSVPHPLVGGKLDKKASIAFAEINMDMFSQKQAKAIWYQEPSRFPSIDIDLSFVGDVDSFAFDVAHEACQKLCGELLTSIRVTDRFDGDGVSSLTMRFSFSSPERTLTKAELTPLTDAILAYMQDVGMPMKQ